MGSLHTHALFPHGTGPYSAHWSEEAHTAPSAGKIFAPCMIPGPSARKRPGKIRALCMIPRPSTQKCRLPGNIRPLCIRNRPIASRNGYTGRRSCHPRFEKNAFRVNVAREAALFVQSAKREYTRHDYCHMKRLLPHRPKRSQGHNKAIGRRNANPKEDPRTTAKSPNTKAIPTRPSFLAPRSSAQISLTPRRLPQGRQPSQPETISKAAQHQGSLEKSCLRKLIRRSSMSA